MQQFLLELYLFLKKEFLLEYRIKSAISSIILFAIVSISIPFFSLAGLVFEKEISLSFLWNTIFFIVITIGQKSFIYEVEEKTILFLRLTFQPSIIFFGKMLYNILISIVFSSMLWIGFSFSFDIPIQNIPLIIIIILISSINLSVIITLLSAMLSQIKGSTGLLIAMAFPLLIGLLWFLFQLSVEACSSNSYSEIIFELQLVLIYSIVMTPIAYLLFEVIWVD